MAITELTHATNIAAKFANGIAKGAVSLTRTNSKSPSKANTPVDSFDSSRPGPDESANLADQLRKLSYSNRNNSANFRPATNSLQAITFGGQGDKPAISPNPTSWTDRGINMLQSSLSPLSEANQELLATGINSLMPQILKQMGVDFALEDLGKADGKTYTQDGKIHMRINSNLSPQDRAIAILHETVHVPNQKKIQAEIERLAQTGNAYGNPYEVMWKNEITAYKVQAAISTILTPENDIDLKRTRLILLSILGGPSVEEQLKKSPYQSVYKQSQAVKGAQKGNR